LPTLALLFDFEFANRSLFNGLYKRTQSFFERSVLSSVGRVADGEEQRLLAPFADSVTPEVLAGLPSAPVNDGTGRNRANLAKALALLNEAGFKTDGGRVIDPKTGQPLTFEILVNAQQRVLAGFQANLGRIGIVASIRQVDGAQYQARLRTYDYDMIQYFWPSSLSPGNEQVFRWSEKAEGSLNYAGVNNAAANAMIAAMLSAREPDAFVSAVRALDRVLLSGDYVIPLYHVPRYWVAHASRLKYPQRSALIGVALDTWWMEQP
jgi:peptide/nickel transport system substrate-binding protein